MKRYGGVYEWERDKQRGESMKSRFASIVMDHPVDKVETPASENTNYFVENLGDGSRRSHDSSCGNMRVQSDHFVPHYHQLEGHSDPDLHQNQINLCMSRAQQIKVHHVSS